MLATIVGLHTPDPEHSMRVRKRDARFVRFELEGGRVWALEADTPGGDATKRIYCGWLPADEAQQLIEELGA